MQRGDEAGMSEKRIGTRIHQGENSPGCAAYPQRGVAKEKNARDS